jgi:hypothetical protein
VAVPQLSGRVLRGITAQQSTLAHIFRTGLRYPCLRAGMQLKQKSGIPGNPDSGNNNVL